MPSKRILHLFLMLFAPLAIFAQVTTSSITGTVRNEAGEGVEGATITATHNPSGTVYNTISKKGGTYTLPNVRIGGPYTLKIDFVGFTSQVVNDIQLLLGEPFYHNAVLSTKLQELVNVVVSTTRRPVADRTGASTVIGQRQITTMPTISRSLTDFTRLTPQASGNSFAGRDARYNNIQVDGANLNNNFGLSNDPLPGGGNNPISLDAFEEVSVNIAPFDVRQAGFTGAGINAVTKSGTNTFRGSLYGFYRDQSFNGRNVGKVELPEATFQKNKTFGGTLGGPIIKNKLFFFVNAEFEERTFPGINFSPKGGSGAGTVSSTHVDSLKKLSDYLRQNYGYETGSYDNFPNFAAKNHKILAKIDWNINKTHKLTAKYNELVSNNDVALNATSVPNGGGFTPRGGSGSVSRMPNNRFGPRSMSFANSNYGFEDAVRSGTLELNSNFGGRFANQLLGTFSKINATRTSPSQLFPFIDIMNNDGQNYMSAGYEPYSYNNDVVNDIWNITNNFSYFAGKHTITAGASYEYQRVGNMFMAGSQSYYVFSSLQDLMTNQAPAYYAYTYSLVPGKPAVYSAELKIGQLGVYLQDEYTANEKLKLIYGVRIDKPIFHEKPLENAEVTKLAFPNLEGKATHYNTGEWPKSSIYWSPRVGFRYDVKGNKDLIVRGGTGLFTGRLPFVWLTNIPTNSGVYQFGASVRTTSELQNYKFNPDPDAYRSTFPSQPGSAVPSNIVVTDPEFRFPQIWRTNLAVDKRFGNGWSVTLEALATKDVQAIRMRNVNQKAPNSSFNGPDMRPRYLSSNDRRFFSNITSAVVLENTNKGGGASFTAQVNKSFNRGLYGSLAYTYTIAKDVTANPGSQASSVWNANPAIGTQNDLELAYSQYAVPHRIVGNVSYRYEYIKHLATTISIFYEGTSPGNFSYVYNGDLNNDGNNSTDLLYIPKDASEIIFVNQTASGSNAAYTAAEQSAAFFKFVENSPYLKENKGKYAERNAARLPWYNRVDMKILQDIFTDIGSRRHTLQVSLDVLNAANLISKNWGIRQQTILNNPLVPAGVNAQGQPTFRMTQVGGVLPTDPFQDVNTTSSTWGLQVGVRYIF